MNIGNFKLEKGKTFILAELSANHGGSFNVAADAIKAAKLAGADGIKLQTYTPDTMTLNIKTPHFTIQSDTLWDGITYYDLYKSAAMPWEWQPKLKKIADDLGLELFSSPFDKTAVDFLESINVPAYKIASFEITDLPLIRYAASKGKPMIISTGIATYDEIEDAVNVCREVGNNEIVLLKCTSAYPAPIEEANLLTIPLLAKDFGVYAGLSDHTMDNITSVVAVTLGASIIEKHFIPDIHMDSPDKPFSLTPLDFEALVTDIRKTERAMGVATYDLTPASFKGRSFTRSLYAIDDICAGQIFSEKNIASLRPFAELSPKLFDKILGKKAKCSITKGSPIKKDMFE